MIFLEYNFDNKNNPITGLDRRLGFQEVEAQISRQSAHEGGKVVSPTHRPPYSQEISGTHFY
jgi:hypothetical protein